MVHVDVNWVGYCLAQPSDAIIVLQINYNIFTYNQVVKLKNLNWLENDKSLKMITLSNGKIIENSFEPPI